ncbi:MAG: 3-isopropylmalate dehydrogenase [Nocardioidaceae bacterium]|nr:3-isopropylmalate dehydrogenase [Nocardioidaceae bacterium]
MRRPRRSRTSAHRASTDLPSSRWRRFRCTTCTPSGVRPGTARRTRQPWRASRPDSTCETTAASARTTTRVRRVPQPTDQQTQSYRLAVVPGDGIGPEVTAEAVKVLDEAATAAGVKFEPTRYDLGAEHYLAKGEVLPDTVLAEIREHDAILLGAVGGKPGDPNLPPGLLERGLLLRLRFELDHYVNLRPSRIYPGAASPLADPGEVDFLVVREGTEGPYVGNGGALRVGTPQEIATEVSVNTAFGVERVVRDAFARARKRDRKKLTLVHKTNVLVHAGGVWSRAVQRVAEEFPEVTVDYLHVDAATIFLATDPSRFDVVVTDNLFGDIITDLAAAVTGGIGLAASGNVNPDRTAPSMFEPVHGSAPDIAGLQQADPTAAILSGALLLEHLGLDDAARAVEAAVTADLAARDGSPRRTCEIGDAVAARVSG